MSDIDILAVFDEPTEAHRWMVEEDVYWYNDELAYGREDRSPTRVLFLETDGRVARDMHVENATFIEQRFIVLEDKCRKAGYRPVRVGTNDWGKPLDGIPQQPNPPF